jgi:hypothetical protein
VLEHERQREVLPQIREAIAAARSAVA